METTTSGKGIVGDTTNYSWVGITDYEQLAREAGFSFIKGEEDGEPCIKCASDLQDIYFFGDMENKNTMSSFYLQALIIHGINGYWFNGWSKDLIYNTDEIGLSKRVYPEHLRNNK